MRVAGVMSGTSLDGIDVAIVDMRGTRIQTVGFQSTPYPESTRAALLGGTDAARLSRLNFQLGELYARAIRKAIRRFGPVSLIGCHGQTVFHEGGANTLQIGEAAVIAEATGVPVVSNFRARDIAAGGQGAPLVPYVDFRLFRHPRRARIALNIGGIANITHIPAAASPQNVIAFDTGPGNM
ncbi:MAG TPA: anhydro-N-acetylmuramic acid kinase, partial [Candidatus Binatus sp.]|nr:anhydro-N-acetylmuramic acid kinase [Candidatus Binatus sp.]